MQFRFIQAHSIDEVEDFVGIASSLLVNMGTLESDWIQSMKLAANKCVEIGKPWVLDPVAAGAASALSTPPATRPQHEHRHRHNTVCLPRSPWPSFYSMCYRRAGPAAVDACSTPVALPPPPFPPRSPTACPHACLQPTCIRQHMHVPPDSRTTVPWPTAVSPAQTPQLHQRMSHMHHTESADNHPPPVDNA